MKWTLASVTTWQTLRVLARNGNAPVPGKLLRVDRSRRSKDGTFLDELVTMGLLEVVTPAEPLKPTFRGSAVEPVQFRTTYRLTPAGLETADTGEFEKSDPSPLPIKKSTGKQHR